MPASRLIHSLSQSLKLEQCRWYNQLFLKGKYNLTERKRPNDGRGGLQPLENLKHTLPSLMSGGMIRRVDKVVECCILLTHNARVLPPSPPLPNVRYQLQTMPFY